MSEGDSEFHFICVRIEEEERKAPATKYKPLADAQNRIGCSYLSYAITRILISSAAIASSRATLSLLNPLAIVASSKVHLARG